MKNLRALSPLHIMSKVSGQGDRRLGRAIEAAWKSGCRFDSWTEKVAFDKWMDAFNACGIEPDWYSSRHIPLDEVLPWDHLHTGIEKEFLLKEYKRAESGRTIPDCRYGLCPNCGLCDMEAVRGEKSEGIRPIAYKHDENNPPLPLGTEFNSVPEKKGQGGFESENRKLEVRVKVRIR